MRNFKMQLLAGLIFITYKVNAQTEVQDKASGHQENRMEYAYWKYWDPKIGNWEYYFDSRAFINGYDYRNTDRRILAGSFPYPTNMALTTTEIIADTATQRLSANTRNTMFAEQLHRTGGAVLDLIWDVYYADVFDGLENDIKSSIVNQPQNVQEYLITSGLLIYFNRQLDILHERVQTIHNANMEKGDRIFSYENAITQYNTIANAVAKANMKITKGMNLLVRNGNGITFKIGFSGQPMYNSSNIKLNILSHYKF